jgi:putative membrane protein
VADAAEQRVVGRDEARRRPSPASANHAGAVRLRRSPWRVVVARVVVNALAVAIVVLALPGVKESSGHPVLGYLALGAVLGLINAFVKPVFQFVALPGLLGSMGLVVIFVDIFTFWLLDAVTGLLSIDRPVWVALAGASLGFLSYALDNLLGLTPPILSDRRDEEQT